MITVKLLGGARKSFSADKLEISNPGTISGLVGDIQNLIPQNLPKLDPDNILVAVNGVDSSALQGKDTVLQDGDVITIIPLVHGGTSKRIHLDVSGTGVELVRIGKMQDPVEFLDLMRKKYPSILVQGIDARYILGIGHVKKILAISLAAKKAGTLLSNKVETDILMRFACTRQISDAISKVGVKPGHDFILLILGRKSLVTKLFHEIEGKLESGIFEKNNAKLVQKEFGITQKAIDCVISKTPLEDLLAEKAAATLFH
jgi:tRNA threonylcarbamoyladenosine modification (KEOPS) complex Cgi121 subunit/molybdopterin converting factor small subunit